LFHVPDFNRDWLAARGRRFGGGGWRFGGSGWRLSGGRGRFSGGCGLFDLRRGGLGGLGAGSGKLVMTRNTGPTEFSFHFALKKTWLFALVEHFAFRCLSILILFDPPPPYPTTRSQRNLHPTQPASLVE
jgi:hypothetical protein